MPQPVLVEFFFHSKSSSLLIFLSFFSLFDFFFKGVLLNFYGGGSAPTGLGGGGRFFFFFDFRQGTTPGRFWWKGGFCFTFRSWWWGRRRAIRNPRGNEGPRHLCHRCLIKAQAAASVGPTGLSLDFAKKGELDDLTSCKEKGASASATCFAYAQLSDLPRP